MTRYSSEPTSATAPSYGPPERARRVPPRPGSSELEDWLRDRSGRLQSAWAEEVKLRSAVADGDFERVVDRFVGELVRMLPLTLGPRRQEVAPLWARACELFGTVAARRGLASGEVIEELHILRELVIQDLFRDPPAGMGPLSLGQVLRLNRAFDRGVTQASVGHTDALFFQLLDPEANARSVSSEETAREAEAQLDQITTELCELFATRASPDGEGGRES